ncbi:MAG: hypothetical protein RLY43_1067 [Bacteroidota bacterium]|jgi:FkbM family methyltransferase
MSFNKKERIEVAISCSDCDYIAKVENAGKVFINPEGKQYQVMHNGILTFTDSHYGDFNVEIIEKLGGHHEPQEEKVFFEILKHLRPGATMIELGAFWGYYSLWFKSQITDSEVYLVEPMETMLKYGIENFKLNNLVGNFSQFAIGKSSLNDIEFEHWDGKKYLINQINVDSLLNHYRLTKCDILHADIQGFELDMLHGAIESLKSKCIMNIFISTHSNPIHYKCLSLLKKYGYFIVAEHNLYESFASDGLIVATLNPSIGKISISKKRSFINLIKKLKYIFY